MIDRWIAEATECDFKVALEVKKPKSWLKSVSAFANGIGGTLFFGIDDGRNVIGLSDAQTDAEMISRLIKERITPYPSFVLAPERENGKDILPHPFSACRGGVKSPVDKHAETCVAVPLHPPVIGFSVKFVHRFASSCFSFILVMIQSTISHGSESLRQADIRNPLRYLLDSVKS